MMFDDTGAMRCSSCDGRFRVDEGILRCVSRDDFYEGAYEGEIKFVDDGSLLAQIKLYLINTHYLYWLKKYVAPGSRLLELGCGGGVRFLAQYARTTAVDLSFSSLKNLDPRYQAGVQADALRLPFADASYDAVTSAYFYEHIPLTDKPALLEELKRVVKPGGRLVLLFDTASHSPLFQWLRRNPELFQERFVENDHHYGLETAPDNVARFESAGLKILAKHCANKTPLQHLPVYEWMRPYGGAAALLATAGHAVANHRVLQPLYTSALTLFDDVVEPVLPADWGRIMLVVLERR